VSSITPRRAGLGVTLILLATLPIWVGNTYYINIASQILLWAILALALNVLVGWAGLTSLGHAGLFAMAGYTAAMLLAAGYNHFTADIVAIAVTLATTAVFAVLALRATGIGFLMITLAIGQILWGIAYRWVSLTNGDNGINVSTRPAPFGISLTGASSFYLATLVVFLIAVASMAVFVRSPFGAALRGTRDQARRMTALGYNVWLIRFLAILFSGFWSGIAGLLFIYYNQFIGPQVVALTTSAEALLMVISGGSGTLLGPIVGAAIVVIMKNVVSAYIERWNLVLGVIFILIISFMPEGLVPGSVRLWRAGWARVWGLRWGQTPSIDRPATTGSSRGLTPTTLTPSRQPERAP
jgi:branched-chain amino acid transport system permease protein